MLWSMLIAARRLAIARAPLSMLAGSFLIAYYAGYSEAWREVCEWPPETELLNH